MATPAPARRVRFQPPTPMRARTETRHTTTTVDDDDEDELAQVRAALHPLLQWDLDAVRWLVRLRETTPWLQALVAATTSKCRTQDFSLVLWLVFLVMTPELGLAYLWIVVLNLLGVLLLQYLAQVLRPVDLDASLRSLPRSLDPDTGGFPCVDAHMAVVVLLPVVENTPSRVAQLAFACLGLYLAATRLLLGARFVSQTLGSWLTGLTGLVVGNHGHVVVQSYRLSRGYHTAAVVALIALLLVVVGQWVENNDSRVLGVPKRDFMDVLTNILRSDGAPTTTSTTSTTNVARVHQFPPRTHREDQGEDDAASEEQELLGKKDSFYYLLRSMRARAAQQQQQQYRRRL